MVKKKDTDENISDEHSRRSEHKKEDVERLEFNTDKKSDMKNILI